ncbi:interleukin-15 isoform X1 [Pelobates cultripes]|uniref:Interleukin n=1 Tax=Pelobates cultripes TaxID=61616 RepID=A0AAD1WEH5_PELCU|nr:interleukin-15 isoform X1 [Pelobates cultripes]
MRISYTGKGCLNVARLTTALDKKGTHTIHATRLEHTRGPTAGTRSDLPTLPPVATPLMQHTEVEGGAGGGSWFYLSGYTPTARGYAHHFGDNSQHGPLTMQPAYCRQDKLFAWSKVQKERSKLVTSAIIYDSILEDMNEFHKEIKKTTYWRNYTGMEIKLYTARILSNDHCSASVVQCYLKELHTVVEELKLTGEDSRESENLLNLMESNHKQLEDSHGCPECEDYEEKYLEEFINEFRNQIHKINSIKKIK